jgi:hypothetical protein
MNVQPDPRYADVAVASREQAAHEAPDHDPSEEHTNTRDSDTGVEARPHDRAPKASARVEAAPTEPPSAFPRAG